MKKECPKCGYMNDQYDKSCMSCGTQLKDVVHNRKKVTTQQSKEINYRKLNVRTSKYKLQTALSVLIGTTILIVIMYLINLLLQKGFGFFFWITLVVNNFSVIFVFVYLKGFISEYIEVEEELISRIEILERKSNK